MSKPILRLLLVILMYAGVIIFLLPYTFGTLSAGIPFLIGGASLTVVCGLLRCCLTEGTCSDRTFSRPCP